MKAEHPLMWWAIGCKPSRSGPADSSHPSRWLLRKHCQTPRMLFLSFLRSKMIFLNVYFIIYSMHAFLSQRGVYIRIYYENNVKLCFKCGLHAVYRKSVAYLVFADPSGKIIISIGFSTGNNKHICKFKVILNTKLCQDNEFSMSETTAMMYYYFTLTGWPLACYLWYGSLQTIY